MHIKEAIRKELFSRLNETGYSYSGSYPNKVVFPSIILDEVQEVGRETFILYFHLFSDSSSTKEILDMQEALDNALSGFSVQERNLLSFKFLNGRELKEIEPDKTIRHNTADYEFRCF